MRTDHIRLLAAGTALVAISHAAWAQNAPPGIPTTTAADPSIADPAASSPVAASPAAANAPAPADTSNTSQSSGVADIVVTANKREERLQKVPVAITLVSGGQLAQQNITDISGIARAAPALNVAGPYGAFSIRGIGSISFSRSSEGSVGVVVDGVALANTSGNPPQLFDVARVEVLAGPQGTLFGRNSSAGVLNIVTNAPDPSKVEAIFHTDIGTRNSQIVDAVLNLPTSSNSALRISGAFSDSPKNQHNLYDGSWYQNEGKSLRARFKWDPIDAITFNIIGDYNRVSRGGGSPWTVYADTPSTPATATSKAVNRGIAIGLANCGVTASQNNDDGCNDATTHVNDTSWGVSAQGDFRFGDYTLSSISAFREFTEKGIGQDADSGAQNILDQNYSPFDTQNFSQELRLSSPSTGLITFVAGLYYFDSAVVSGNDKLGNLLTYIAGIPNLLLGQDAVTRSSITSDAAFGQATLNMSSRFRLIAGGRVGHEAVDANTRRTLAPGAVASFSGLVPISARVTDNYFSYRGGAQFDLTRAIMAYATYTKGYKGPSVNDQATTTTVPLIVKPEIPRDFEVGLKTSFLHGRLAANLALFDTKVTNFQAQFFDPTANQFVFGNAPKLTSKGVSLDLFGQVSRNFTVNAGLLYADAKYGHGYEVICAQMQTVAEGCVPVAGQTRGITDADGNQLIGSPKWKVTASAEYRHDIGERLQAYLQGDMVYTSKIYFDAAYDPADTIGSAAIFGGRLGVRTQDKRYGIAVYARNIFDKRLAVVRFETPTAQYENDPSSYSQIFGDDSFRSVGVSLDARF